jgi:RNA-directed DNA polymerase
MPDGRARLAIALADAFLAGAWTSDGLRTQGQLVLGARHAWLRRLAREVIKAYPEPPSDRPRELFAFVLQTQAMAQVERRAARPGGGFPLPLHRLTAPTSMIRHPFPVTSLDHAGDLAALLGVSMEELLWFADTNGLQRRARSDRLQHYRSTWVPSVSGGRLLEAPLPRLKAIQRQILAQILTPIPVHDAAHGFVVGRSARTGAAPHVGTGLLISLDLESFFASITGSRIYGVLRAAGYPEPVAHLLTGLCATATPVRVLAAMPGTAAPSAFRLRRRLAEPHLPQGAPTSPQLANLCAFAIDRRLSAYASAIGAVYTRYADDLTFSGDTLVVRQRGVVAAVARIVAEEGFRLHIGKTRTRGRDARQQVTGVVVNASTTVPRRDYDTLRAILHNCVTHGPSTQNRVEHNDFRAHLRGRISWVASLDAGRGRKLLATFEQIDWT